MSLCLQGIYHFQYCYVLTHTHTEVLCAESCTFACPWYACHYCRIPSISCLSPTISVLDEEAQASPSQFPPPFTHTCPYSGWQLHIPGGLTFEIKAVDKIEGVLREKKAVNNTKPSSRWNRSQDNLRYSITIHMSSGSLKATLYWFIRKSAFFPLSFHQQRAHAQTEYMG